MAEELSRNRKQHDGHRSTATRIISSVIEILRAGDISRVREYAVKLRQQRVTLDSRGKTLTSSGI